MPKHFFVYQKPSSAHLGILRYGQLSWPIIIGRSGIVARKREGDGATPLSSMTLLGSYARKDRRKYFAVKGLPQYGIKDQDGWCDDPTSLRYNRPITLPSALSHERLKRSDNRYDRIGILDYNMIARRRGFGSAIFLHQCPDFTKGTEGCIALKEKDFKNLMRYLHKKTRFIVKK